jgi:FtsH-binding integral membrane protein
MIQPNLYKESALLSKIYEKKYFMLAVFLTLLLQLCLFHSSFQSVKPEKKEKEGKEEKKKAKKKVFLFLGVFILFFLILFFVPTPRWLTFLFFCILSFSLGKMFAYSKEIELLKPYIDVSLEVMIFHSLLGLLIVFLFVSLLLILLKNKITLSTIYFFLYLGLVSILLRMVTNFDSTITVKIRYYTVFVFIVVSLFLIYNTYNILYRDYGGNFVSASFDYFTDPFIITNKNLEKLIFL